MSNRESVGKVARHAIIGCGRVAANHALGATASGAELLWCCDIEEERARNLAEHYGASGFSTDVHDVFGDSAVDSVSVCTDHGSHADLCIEAMAHGKHVLVEKPISINARQGSRMIAVSERENVLLGVCFQHRFDGLWRAIRETVRNGVLGKVTAVSVVVQCSKPPTYYAGWRGTLAQEGGSALINQGIHALDLVIWTLGIPEVLFAASDVLKFNGQIETEDTLSGMLRFPEGTLGTLLCTNTSAIEWDTRVEFIGTKGRIAATVGFPNSLLSCDIDEGRRQCANKLHRLSESPKSPPTGVTYYGASHTDLLRAFLLSVTSGVPFPVDAREGLRTISVVDNIYRACS